MCVCSSDLATATLSTLKKSYMQSCPGLSSKVTTGSQSQLGLPTTTSRICLEHSFALCHTRLAAYLGQVTVPRVPDSNPCRLSTSSSMTKRLRHEVPTYRTKLWINLPELGILPLSSSCGLNTIICPDKKLEEEWTRPRGDSTMPTEQRCSNNAHNPENTSSHKNQERQGTAAPGKRKQSLLTLFFCLEKLASGLYVCKTIHTLVISFSSCRKLVHSSQWPWTAPTECQQAELIVTRTVPSSQICELDSVSHHYLLKWALMKVNGVESFKQSIKWMDHFP